MEPEQKMKNLNSFKAIAHAIEGERERQIELLEMEKVLYRKPEDGMITKSPPMQCVPRRMQRITVISRIRIFRLCIFPMSGSKKLKVSFQSSVKKKQPAIKVNSDFRSTMRRSLQNPEHLAALFEEVATLCGNPKKAANWFMVEVLRLMKDKGVEPEKVRFTPKHLADLLEYG